jgi:hypothetical protein
MTERVPVWVLLGQNMGDNNQLLRLANEVGLPFRMIELHYSALSVLPPGLLGATFAVLEKESRAEIRQPWPDLVLGIGFRSVPVALAIREKSGGKTRLVRLGNPRRDPRNFDLTVTTSQYSVADAPNLMRLPVGISTAGKLEPTPEEKQWLDDLPRPHRLLLIGGDTFMWKLTPEKMSDAAVEIRSKCQRDGGSVIAVSSSRSSRAVQSAVAKALDGSRHGLVWGRFPRYSVLLNDADEVYATADSVAMASDAVATGKPVGLVLPEKSASGRLFYGLAKAGVPIPIRDVERFWTAVQASGLAGDVAKPVTGKLGLDPLETVVSRVRSLLKS